MINWIGENIVLIISLIVLYTLFYRIEKTIKDLDFRMRKIEKRFPDVDYEKEYNLPPYHDFDTQ